MYVVKWPVLGLQHAPENSVFPPSIFSTLCIIRLCCPVSKKVKWKKFTWSERHRFCILTYTNWRHPAISVLNRSIWALILTFSSLVMLESKVIGIVPLTEMEREEKKSHFSSFLIKKQSVTLKLISLHSDWQKKFRSLKSILNFFTFLAVKCCMSLNWIWTSQRLSTFENWP